jgi:hypothetical protein
MTGTRFVALVALADFQWVPPAVLTERIRTIDPSMVPHEVGSDPAREGENYLLSLGDKRVLTVAFVTQPIPLDTFATAVVPAAADEEAQLSAELERHRASIIIGLLRAAHDRESCVAAATGLTVAIAALTELVPAVAVYWTEADLVSSPAYFREQALLASPEYSPIDIWTSLRVIDGQDTVDGARMQGMVSKGLTPFVGRELEFAPTTAPASFMAQSLYAMMLYLMESGYELPPGQSFALTEEDAVRIQLSDEGADGAGPVYRLVLEPLQASAVAGA